jgi:uncharacterized membrane protein
MEKVKKIINSISWVIVALTGILLIVKWNDIPALVITHIGMGISYGSKNILPMLFCIELVVTFLFTLRYDIPFIREMRKSKVSRKFLDGDYHSNGWCGYTVTICSISGCSMRL